MKKILLIFVLAGSALAQSIYVGVGPSAYANTAPHFAGNLTFGLCTANEATCSLSNVEALGSFRVPSSLNWSVETGLKRRLFLFQPSTFTVELYSLAMGGGAISPMSSGGVFSAGGGVLLRTDKFPSWSLAIAVRAAYSPVNPGWQPWGGMQLGYTFRSIIPLTSRKAVMY